MPIRATAGYGRRAPATGPGFGALLELATPDIERAHVGESQERAAAAGCSTRGIDSQPLTCPTCT